VFRSIFPERSRRWKAIWGASHAALVRDFDGAQLAALDPGLLQLVISAQNISTSELQAAYAEMRALSQRMQLFHQDYDLLLTPTIPITAFAAGVDTPDATRFPQWFDWTPLTWPFNLTRQPAASVPCGFCRRSADRACRSWGRCSPSRTFFGRAAASSRPAPPVRGRALARVAFLHTKDNDCDTPAASRGSGGISSRNERHLRSRNSSRPCSTAARIATSPSA
jgi:hypothetical protein